MMTVPLDDVPEKVPFDRERHRQDWGRALEMMTNLEGGKPNVDHSETDDDDDEIGIYDNSGRKLFAYHSDGTVECSAEQDLPAAAIIFFREVINVAESQGFNVIPLRNSPESPQKYEGGDYL